MVAREDVAYLCRRAGFGATSAELDQLSTHPTINALVDAIVDDPRNTTTAKPKPGPPSGNTDCGYKGYLKVVQFGRWYLERMAAARFVVPAKSNAGAPLHEKMVLFWHGLLVSSFQKPQNACQNKTLLAQHELFRKHALGDYEALLIDVSKDPAMLIYLDNAVSTKYDINQNYGRELLELFSIGVGNFTQDDVIGASRAGTGYSLDNRTRYVFKPADHDNDTKSFFGVNANWDLTGAAGTSGGNDVVRYLCTSKQDLVAAYLTKMLWQYFANFTPSPATVASVAASFRQSGRLSVKDACKAIFKHPDFWTPAARNGKVKTPPEWVAVCARALAFTKLPKYRNGDDVFSGATDQMGLFLFNQPSVFGWWRRPENRWIGYPAFVAKVDVINQLTWTALDNNKHPLWSIRSAPTAQAVDTVLSWFLVDPAAAGPTRVRAIEMLDRQRSEGAGDYWELFNLTRLIALSPAVQVN